MQTGRSVLVLDDDPSVLKGIGRLLKAHGFLAELFDSIEAFHDRANLSEALCLVLDINLNGKSGIELRRQIASSGASLPVIFITAIDNDATRTSALEAGCVDYLEKPFAAKSLIDAIVRASVW